MQESTVLNLASELELAESRLSHSPTDSIGSRRLLNHCGGILVSNLLLESNHPAGP